MKTRPKVLALVMAGGEGSRLHSLTTHRCKPAVPFNGKHRLVDFVLSNLVNSEVYAIYLLVQYKSQALIEHVRQTWNMTRFLPEHFVTVVPPQMHRGQEWFQGTADSVLQNLHLIEAFQPDLVAVFGADHIYRMDVREMVDFHCDNQADVSVATLPVPLDQCNQFGILEIDSRHRVRAFDEKPMQTPSMPGKPGFALASMGNYLFSTEVLLAELRQAHAAGESDFGRHILPRMVNTHKVMAYDFATHTVPGVQPHEDPHYWRDVGTVDAYFDAHFDTLGTQPKFRIGNRHWPIYASADQGESAQIENGQITHSSLGTGSVVHGARLDHAMLRRSVQVDPEAEVEHCIVMERSVIGRGAKLRRVIVDQNNHIPPGEVIGHDLAHDRQRFHVSDGGVVLVPAGYFPADGLTAARHQDTRPTQPTGSSAPGAEHGPALGGVASQARSDGSAAVLAPAARDNTNTAATLAGPAVGRLLTIPRPPAEGRPPAESGRSPSGMPQSTRLARWG